MNSYKYRRKGKRLDKRLAIWFSSAVMWHDQTASDVNSLTLLTLVCFKMKATLQYRTIESNFPITSEMLPK